MEWRNHIISIDAIPAFFLVATVFAASGFKLVGQAAWVNISPPMDNSHEIGSVCLNEVGEGLVATMRHNDFGGSVEVVLWFTSDGGLTWEARDANGYPFLIRSSVVYQVNSQRWFSAGWDGYVMRSDDGGFNWVSATLAFLLGNAEDIHFFNDSTGIVNTHNTSFYTVDAGDTWQYQVLPETQGSTLNFLNDSIGYLIGRKVWRTANAGQDWSLAGTAPTRLHRAHIFSDFSMLGLPKIYNPGNPLLYESRDVGNTWIERPLVTTEVESIDDLYFFNDDEGIVVGRGWDSTVVVFMTKDAGLTWSEVYRDALPYVGYIRLRPVGDGRMIMYSEYGKFLLISEGPLTGIPVQGLPSHQRFTLAPNPLVSVGRLTIDPPARNGRMHLYSGTGSPIKVIDQVNGPSVALDVQDLSPGIYFLQLIEDKIVSDALRFVVQ